MEDVGSVDCGAESRLPATSLQRPFRPGWKCRKNSRLSPRQTPRRRIQRMRVLVRPVGYNNFVFHNVDRSNFSFEEANIAEHLPNGIDYVGQNRSPLLHEASPAKANNQDLVNRIVTM